MRLQVGVDFSGEIVRRRALTQEDSVRERLPEMVGIFVLVFNWINNVEFEEVEHAAIDQFLDSGPVFGVLVEDFLQEGKAGRLFFV